MNKIEYIGKCALIDEKSERALIVGDLHLGFEEYLNNSGILVSRQMYKEIVEYFEKVYKRSGKVDKIVLLGDVKHDFGKIGKQEWFESLELFDYLKKTFLKIKGKIIIVKGNHDKLIEPIVKRKKFVELVDFYLIGKSAFIHGDRMFEILKSNKIERIFLGHGHPAIKLKEGNKIEIYKCYLVGSWKEKEIIVCPSFIDYREGSDPRENEMKYFEKLDLNNFKALIIDEELNVLNFGKIGKIQN